MRTFSIGCRGCRVTDLPDGWVEVPFAEVIDFQEGPGIMARDFRDQGVPLIRLAGLAEDANVLQGCNYLDPVAVAARWSHFRLLEGDTLLSTSASLGKVARVDSDAEGAIAYTGIIRMRPRDGRVHRSFVRHLLRGPAFQQQAEAFGAGSVMRHFGPSHLRQMTVTLPPVEEQSAISRTLDPLEEKIALNRRRCESLEEIAEAVFRSRFIDFDGADELIDSEIGWVPRGWGVTPLGELVELTIGGVWGDDAPSAKATVAVRCLRGIDLDDLAQGGVPDPPIRYVSDSQLQKRSLENTDLLIEASGSFCGRTLAFTREFGDLYDEPILYSNFVKRFRAPDQMSALFAWFHLRDWYKSGEVSAFRTGSAFPNLDVQAVLDRVRVPLPPEPALREFAPFAALALNTTYRQQSRTLGELRDTLLPRLISGEVRVPVSSYDDEAAWA